MDPIRDTLGRTAEEDAREFFEFELCGECGRDAEDHTPILLLGNWFFRCNRPADETGAES